MLYLEWYDVKLIEKSWSFQKQCVFPLFSEKKKKHLQKLCKCLIISVDQLELLFAPIDTQEVRVYGPSHILGYCATLQIVAGCSDKCRYFCRYFSGRCDNRGGTGAG